MLADLVQCSCYVGLQPGFTKRGGMAVRSKALVMLRRCWHAGLHLKAAKRLETAAGKVGLGLSDLVLLLCFAALQLEVAKRSTLAARRHSWEAAQRRSRSDKRLLREEAAERRGASGKRSLCEEVAQPRKQFIHPSIIALIGSFFHRFLNSLFHCFIDSLVHWFIDCLIHWFSDSLIGCFIGSSFWWSASLIRRFADSLNHWFCDWLIASVIVSLVHWLTDDSLIRWFVASLIYWLIDSQNHWFCDWFIAQVSDSLIHRLTDSLVRCWLGFIDSLIGWFIDSLICRFNGSSRSTSWTSPFRWLASWSSVGAGSNVATTIVSLLAKLASTTLQCILLFAMIQPCSAQKVPDNHGNGTTTDALLRLSFLGGLMVFALGWDWLTTTNPCNWSPKTGKTKKNKRNMAYQNKKRKLFHIRVALAARTIGKQREAYKRLWRRRIATVGIPLAFPWVRCCPGPNETQQRLDLAGGVGAGESTVTKRKRWNKQQPGLATALMQVLQQYDRANKQHDENRSKRQRKNTWNKHDPCGTRQGQDNTLASTWLQLLQTQQFNSDAHLANTIVSTINKHGANTSQQPNWQKPSRFATTTQQSPPQTAHDRSGGKSNNRWNKPKPKADGHHPTGSCWVDNTTSAHQIQPTDWCDQEARAQPTQHLRGHHASRIRHAVHLLDYLQLPASFHFDLHRGSPENHRKYPYQCQDQATACKNLQSWKYQPRGTWWQSTMSLAVHTNTVQGGWHSQSWTHHNPNRSPTGIQAAILRKRQCPKKIDGHRHLVHRWIHHYHSLRRQMDQTMGWAQRTIWTSGWIR